MTAHSAPGQCRDCMKRREVFACSRLNGGNYRIAQRWRSSSICAECATDLLCLATPDHGARGWNVSTLYDIVASLDTGTARDALAAYDAREAEHRARREAEDIRMRPYWDRIAERREAVDWIRAQADADGMDARTCRVLAGDITRGEAGNERTGATFEPGQPTRWDRTMRQQVIDYLTGPEHDHLAAATIAALVDGIRAGAHRPDGQ